MQITKHAVERFKERVTPESTDVIKMFIESDIKRSTVLYSVNGIEEKRLCDGIIYVIKKTKSNQDIVITLYLKEEEYINK